MAARNHEINCMRASGWAEYDGKRYVFDPARHFGTKKTGQSLVRLTCFYVSLFGSNFLL